MTFQEAFAREMVKQLRAKFSRFIPEPKLSTSPENTMSSGPRVVEFGPYRIIIYDYLIGIKDLQYYGDKQLLHKYWCFNITNPAFSPDKLIAEIMDCMENFNIDLDDTFVYKLAPNYRANS